MRPSHPTGLATDKVRRMRQDTLPPTRGQPASPRSSIDSDAPEPPLVRGFRAHSMTIYSRKGSHDVGCAPIVCHHAQDPPGF